MQIGSQVTVKNYPKINIQQQNNYQTLSFGHINREKINLTRRLMQILIGVAQHLASHQVRYTYYYDYE